MKRKTVVLAGLISLLFLTVAFSSTVGHASSYDSNGQIGFYGEYEEPPQDEEMPPEDSAPAAGNRGSLPPSAGRGSTYSTPTPTASGNRILPQTGQRNYFGINLIGYLLLGFLLLLILKHKKGELPK